MRNADWAKGTCFYILQYHRLFMSEAFIIRDIKALYHFGVYPGCPAHVEIYSDRKDASGQRLGYS